MGNFPSFSYNRFSRVLISTPLAGGLAVSAGITAAATVAPLETAPGKKASVASSSARKWSGIDLSRYEDVVRKTSCITYPGAGRVPQASCNVVGDIHTDMVFLDQKNHQIYILDYIPYGSDKDDVKRSIMEQPGAIRVGLPESDRDRQLSCVKRNRGGNPALVVANGNKIYVSGAGKLADGKVSPTAATYTFGGSVSSLSSLAPGLDTSGMLAAAGDKAHLLDSLPVDDSGVGKAVKSWDIGQGAAQIVPLGNVLNGDTTIGVGKPSQNLVYAIPTEAEPGNAVKVGTTIQASEDAFGTFLVAIGDANGDDLDDFAVGAPEANGSTGAVAIIFGSKQTTGTMSVDVCSVPQIPVVRNGYPVGTLIRQANRGHIGTSLAYVSQYDVDSRGALVILRPGDEKCPGAVTVSEKALGQNWNTGRGLDSISGSQAAVLASEEGGSGDGGYYVGTVPADNLDIDLVGVYIVDAKGEVDVWTVDMRQQNRTTPPAQPILPQPSVSSAAPAYQPVDEAD